MVPRSKVLIPPVEEPVLNEEPIPEPPPVEVGLEVPTPLPAVEDGGVTPLAITIVDAANLTHPNNGITSLQYLKRDTAIEADRDPSAAQKTFITPAFSPITGTYTAVDKSRKGYQFKSKIVRPDSFGVYTASDAEEAAFLADLVTAGILTPALIAVPI